LARDLLVLHEKPAGHMQFNACWYLGGIMDKLENVYVAQQETLDQDLEAFRAYFGNATAMGQAPSVERLNRAPMPHANISEASLRTLSVILYAPTITL
jgi:chromosome segregation and condensation protein ScpB